MKEEFQEMNLKLVLFEMPDVIVTSGGIPTEGAGLDEEGGSEEEEDT